MDYLWSAILGIVQGLTEFLPVSSSAHLDVIPAIFKVNSPLLNSLTFDVALHGGTLLALVIFFWKKIVSLCRAFFTGLISKEARKNKEFWTAVYVLIAAIPAGLAGVLAGDRIEDSVREHPAVIGTMLLIFGIVLYLADRAGKKQKEIGEMRILDSIIIGCAQVLALIPGVSRSGSTIMASLFCGFKREDAAEFSFLLSIPVIAGAFLFKLKHILHTPGHEGKAIMVLGFLAAAISGYWAVRFLLGFVKKHSYLVFAIYRGIFGIFLIFWFFKV
jgi:undecaprenyl-diphosphatase